MPKSYRPLDRGSWPSFLPRDVVDNRSVAFAQHRVEESGLLHSDLAAAGWIGMRGQLTLAVTISAVQNDWNPSGWNGGESGITLIKVTLSGGGYNVTGLEVGSIKGADPKDGRMVIIANDDAGNTLTLVDASAASTAINRFALGGANKLLAPGQRIVLVHMRLNNLPRWCNVSGVNG